MIVAQVRVAPTFLAVSLEEAKARLQIEDETRDADLEAHIMTSAEDVEDRTGLTLTRRTYYGFLNDWPVDDRRCPLRYIALPRGPVAAVNFIKTYDDEDVATTFEASNYYLDTSGYEARIVLRSGASFPSVGRVAAGIEIEWTAGFASAAEVPFRARSAILLFTRHLFDDDPEKKEPPGINNLLTRLRTWAF